MFTNISDASVVRAACSRRSVKKITEEQIHELEEIHKEYIPIVEADEIDAKSYTCRIENFILQSIPLVKWTEYVR